jgi:uncharacterized coiled-coil protein SlyX
MDIPFWLSQAYAGPKLDLYHATRDDLIRIILDQRETIADQERRIAAQARELDALRAMVAQLTTQIGALQGQRPQDDAPPRGTPQGMPGLKATERPVREPVPRKRRAQGYARRRMEATAQVVHALAACPDCGAPPNTVYMAETGLTLDRVFLDQ